jgi:hypothetical protein
MFKRYFKLKKHTTRKTENTTYYAYSVHIPSRIVSLLRWNENTELRLDMAGSTLRIREVIRH